MSERRTYTKSELAREYQVTWTTIINWLHRAKVELPDYNRWQKLLTPAQVSAIREAIE